MYRKAALSVDTQPHRFRAGLPAAVLHVEPGPPRSSTVAQAKAKRNEDIRLFLMSFTAFFLAISSFIW